MEHSLTLLKTFSLIIVSMFLFTFVLAEDLDLEKELGTGTLCYTDNKIGTCDDIKEEKTEINLEDNRFYVTTEGLYLKDEKTKEKTKLKDKGSVYIHKYNSKENAWHVDNLNEEPVQTYLELEYNQRPYKVIHYDKEKNHVHSYYSNEYTWIPNCQGEECEDNSGRLIIYAEISAESIGSDIFQIGNATSGWVTQGQYVAEFDGVDDYVDHPNLSISNTTPQTLSVWVKPAIDGVNTPASQPIMNSNFLRLYIRNTDNDVMVRYNTVASSHESLFELGNGFRDWVHIVGTFDGDKTTAIYVNGELKDSDTHPDSPTTNFYAEGDRLGKFYSGTYFDGSMSNILIYNRSLSADDITELYGTYSLTGTENRPLRNSAPNQTNLVFDMNFDNAQTTDNSENNNSGTNYGATFSPTKYETISLTEGVDYTLNTGNGLFTIIENLYEYSYLTLSWNYDEYTPAGEGGRNAIQSLVSVINGIKLLIQAVIFAGIIYIVMKWRQR